MTTNNDFTIRSAFGRAWRSCKKDPWFFLTIVAAILGAQIFAGAVEQAAGDQVIAPLASLIGAVVVSIVSVGVVRALLRFADGKDVNVDGVMPPAQQVLWYILFQIVMFAIIAVTVSIVVAAVVATMATQLPTKEVFVQVLQAQGWHGYWAIIAPQIGAFVGAFAILFGVIAYISTRFFFTTYIIVDKNVNTFKAMRGSSALTKGYRLRIFALICVIVWINFLGVMVFMVGLLVTIPLSIMAITYAYRQRHDALAQRVVRKRSKHVAPSKESVVKKESTAKWQEVKGGAVVTSSEGTAAEDTEHQNTSGRSSDKTQH